VPKAGFGDATSAAILAAAAAGRLGPGGDALELTRSASKAVLVVNLVRLSDADFRWGVVVNPNPSPRPNPNPALTLILILTRWWLVEGLRFA